MEEFVELKEMLMNRTWKEWPSTGMNQLLALFHLCVTMVTIQNSQQERERENVLGKNRTS